MAKKSEEEREGSLFLREKYKRLVNQPRKVGENGRPDNSDKVGDVAGERTTTNTMTEVSLLLPRIAKGKEWYVEFYFFNPAKGKLQRFKKTEGFAQCKTDLERELHGHKLAAKYNGMLRDGWSPLHDSRIIYRDHIERAAAPARMQEATYDLEYYLSVFLEMKEQEQMRDKSVSTYKSKLYLFRQWCRDNKLNAIVLSAFRIVHAQEFYRHLLKKQLHPNTVHHYITMMRNVWNWLDNYDDRLIFKNPWMKIKPKRVSATPQKPFNKIQRQQIFDYLAQLGEHHLLLACKVIFYSFIRPGRELRGLRVKDFNLVNAQITVRGDIAKNKKTETVQMPASLCQAFIDLKLNTYPQDFYVFGTDERPCNIEASRDRWSKRFTKIIRALGYGTEYTMYSWKHTGNQVMHANNAPVEKQRKQNRHHSLEQMQHYLVNLELMNPEEMDDYFK